ncbi:LysR family substrate-binding domain-containing protein [Streptomyces sp. t39]|uniref:LysR family substrate-binding domain-containing protein n=1 Tax=Streptomyces sp. t39 TaxID=1828156 RepID=UPI0011CDBC0B|nr:LysR family substrate-binding domain-containing protein [Streptomyces sp. t39]TXS52929.1 LysR family transcriptional regulator [Streptomyces sp. t39]
MTDSQAALSFRLAYVPGATPAKWVRIWNERMPGVPLTLVPVPAADAVAALRDGDVDAGLVRLPVDRTVLSAIPLYTETTVVVVPKDHAVAAADEVGIEDLADDIVLHPLDDTLDTLGWETPPGTPALERPATTADAVELVAAGIGVLLVPQSLARLHHRRDLTYRPVTDAPQSGVVLSWPEDATTDLVEQFIGIVRGRTVNSSRGRPPATAQQGRGAAEGRGAAAGAGGGKGGGKQGGRRSGGPSSSKPSTGSGARAGARGSRGGSGGSGGAKGAGRGKRGRRS